MKTKVLIIIIFLFFLNNKSFSMNYKEYKAFLRIINIADNLIEDGKFYECLKILNKCDKKNIPFGLESSYYSSMGECYLNIHKITECKHFFSLAFKYGLPEKYFEQLKLNYDTTKSGSVELIKNLRGIFDSIVRSRNTSECIKLNNRIEEMYKRDQEIRFTLLDAKKKGDTTSIKKYIIDLIKIDSTNQIVYDSICNKYNWITKELYFYNFNIKPLIVIYHSDQTQITKYIKKGIFLAEKNKIYWSELLELQTYAIFKNVIYQKPNDIFIIETLSIKDEKVNPNIFAFVLDALYANYVSYIKNNEAKKIELYLNTNLSESDRELYDKLFRIRKKLINLGVKESQIIINQNQFRIADSTKELNTIGVKFI